MWLPGNYMRRLPLDTPIRRFKQTNDWRIFYLENKINKDFFP
jgi:hypothetical protein